MHNADGIGEILKIVIIAGIALFSFVRKAMSGSKPSAPAQPESDEARRVREEIRRKIAERRAGQRPPAPLAPPPVAQRPFASPTAAPRPVMSGGGNTLQDVLRERLRRREAEEAKLRAEQLSRAALAEMTPVQPIVVPVQAEILEKRSERAMHAEVEGSASSLVSDFSDPDALKRAFVMNEILSAPLALRGPRTTAW